MADILTLSESLGSSLSASTNPNPNTLGTIRPFPTPYTNSTSVSSSWTSQGIKALFPVGADYNNPMEPIKFSVTPSGGDAVTYTLTLWFYDILSGVWAKSANSNTVSYTGSIVDYIDNPGRDPMFIQISDLSSGTLIINVDGRLARAF